MAEATRVLWLAVSGSRENSLFIHIHIDHIDLFIGLKNVIYVPLLQGVKPPNPYTSSCGAQ